MEIPGTESKVVLQAAFYQGRKIRARQLYGAYMSEEEPRTIEEIAADFDVPIEAVKEAIAYCESDPPEIRRDMAIEEAIMEATGMNDPDYKYHLKYKMLSPQEVARIYRKVEQRFVTDADARET
jgi:uncharacterized protein (DUF433 family)